MTSHLLRLGPLVLSDGGDPNPAGTDYTFEVIGDDFTLGEASPVEVVMQSFLQDGAVTQKVRDGNREVSFRVIIKAPDSAAMAAGEAALNAQVGIPNDLGWTPPDGWGPESVFDVFTSRMDFKFDDLLEVRSGQRSYVLTLTCYPSTRSRFAVITPALAVPTNPDPTPVNNAITPADSLAGWTVSGGTLVDGGDYLRMAGAEGVNVTATWTTASPVSLTGTPFIYVLVRYPNDKHFSPALKVNGVAATYVKSQAAPQAQFPGYAAYYYRTSQTSVSRIDFADYFTFGNPSRYEDFRLFMATNTATTAGTSRQSGRSIEVAGSVRTTGSLRVWHDTTALGDVLVYTHTAPAGYDPGLRQYFTTQPASVASTSTLSGATNTFSQQSSSVVFQAAIPPGAFYTGAHEFVALIKASAATSCQIICIAQASTDGTPANIVGPPVYQTKRLSLGADYAWVSLFDSALPGVDQPTNGKLWTFVQFSILPPSGSTTTVTLDQVYFLNTDLGDFTALDAGAKRSVWIDGPTVDAPRYRTFVGNAADRSDSYAPTSQQAYGAHSFAPALTSAWIATSGAPAASAQFEHFPRWHTHAAEVD